jgi:hypothetical protein
MTLTPDEAALVQLKRDTDTAEANGTAALLAQQEAAAAKWRVVTAVPYDS